MPLSWVDELLRTRLGKHAQRGVAALAVAQRHAQGNTLAGGASLDADDCVVLLGDSGTGKSHLLIGLGIAACEQGRRVRYVTCA